MSDRLTRPTTTTVAQVLAGVADERRRGEAADAVELLGAVTGVEAVVWGSSMIGFGRQPYTTADGREREWFAVGVAARKAALTLYGLTYYGSNTDLLDRLGPHTTGKGCLYLKKFDAVDHDVLRELVARAWATNHVPQDPAD